MKILLLDIETAPNIAYVWGIFKENIPLDRLINSGYVLCWAAKWLGEPKVMFDSLHQSSKRGMLRSVHKLMEEADVIIHYNGNRFDIPTLNKEFLLAGMTPPAPSRHLDLLSVTRKQFRFPSNKLAYVARALGIEGKFKHSGFQLWINCMNGDKESWKEMEKYNIQDVNLLEDVYMKLLPWIPNHPNYSLYYEVDMICPNCGSNKLSRRGYSYTSVGKYQRFKCRDCGSWHRSRKSENTNKTTSIT